MSYNNYSKFAKFLPSKGKDSHNDGSVGIEKSEIRRNHGASFYHDYFDPGVVSPSLLVSTNNLLASLSSANRSLCQESVSPASTSSPASSPAPPPLFLPPPHDTKHLQLPRPLLFDTEYERRRLLRELDEQPCSACKYTGLALCAGMSLYFLKLGVEESSAGTTRTSIRTSTTLAKAAAAAAAKASSGSGGNKIFFYGGAMTWAVAGLYRSVLD